MGTLDIQRALADGVKAYEPGLLAAAHRGVLYVDEVNLLPDHLVDLLLDAAAMGRAHVERDGVSVKHAARFLLVGTMNPEEGEPRPQLVDRFGLVVTVAAPRERGAAGRGGAAAAGVRGGPGRGSRPGSRPTSGRWRTGSWPPARLLPRVALPDAGAGPDRPGLPGLRGGRDAGRHRGGAVRGGAGGLARPRRW